MSVKEEYNLLLLGAAGGLGRSFVRYFRPLRKRFQNFVLVDRHLNGGWPKDAKFIQLDISGKNREQLYDLIIKYKTTHVLDLSDAPTDVVARTVFATRRASYVNTAFCSPDDRSVLESLPKWLKELPRRLAKPHILCTGMNPGVVNLWAAHAVRDFGRPKEIVEFEYDSSDSKSESGNGLVTWSRQQFILEMLKESAQLMISANRSSTKAKNPLGYCQPLGDYLSPLVKLKNYPSACVTSHEECATLAHKFKVPVQFLYAINDRTMKLLGQAAGKREILAPDDLVFGDNLKIRLTGAEHIGLALDYPDKRVTYFNRVANSAVKKTNATYHQVLVGVFAALHTLLDGHLTHGVYFPEDLLGTPYEKYVFEHLVTTIKVEKRPLKRRSTKSSS